MLLAYFAFVVIACGASADPGPRRSRWFDDPFPFDYRPYPYASAFAGAGLGFPFFDPYIPWRYIPMPDYRMFTPWYKGQNVCETKKVIEEPQEMKEWFNEGFSDSNFKMQSESEQCKGDNNVYMCMKRIQTNEGSKLEMRKYKCCMGFVRSTDGSPGCVENDKADPSVASPSSSSSVRTNDHISYSFVKSNRGGKIDLRYLMPTLRNMGASKLVNIVESVGMADDFHDNNYTVFCPPNSVLDALQSEFEDEVDNEVTVKLSQQKLKKKSHLYNVLTSHLSPGFFRMDDLMDGTILPTDNPECNIRINIYFTPIRVVTANCVPILSADNFARNGIIHVVEKLIPKPSRTVADIIAGDTQFSILKRMLSLAGLVQTLRSPNGSYTMFAPTDSALRPILPTIAGESNNRCIVSVLKHHIIQHVICSSALLHHARSLNMIGEILSMNRDQNNKLYVDDVQVVVRDLVATNGVVHIIDGILSTRQTKPISQVLDESGLYEFLSLIEKANLKTEFDSLENVTFFIPADEVIKSIPPRHLEALLNYNQSIQDVLRYHVVHGRTEMNKPDQLLNSKLKNSTVRFQVHAKYPHMTPQVIVQCATVLSADIKLCGGTLHVVDKLLLPPKQTIVEFLESVEGFSSLVLLLRATGLDRRLNNLKSSFTLFAPTDDAFHELGDEAIFRMLEDIERTTDLVKMHILLGTVCCSQLNGDVLSGRYQTRAMDGSLLSLERSVDNILTVGGAHVVECDIMATNGVIHMVDTVLTHDQTSYLGGKILINFKRI